MKRILFALFLAVSLCGWTHADDYYVDAVGGDDSTGTGTSALPWRTIAKATEVSAGRFAAEAGDFLFLSGTLREPLKLSWQAGHVCDQLWIGQWPGMPQAVIRGDTPTAVADWDETATNTVYEYTIPAGTCAYWDDSGTHKTLREGIVSVTYNWDRSIDQYGRHYGHLAQSDQIVAAVDGVTDLATVLAAMDDQTWLFIPTPAAGSGGGGGTLYIKLAAFADDAALDAAAPQINYVIGNRNGIEIGTPTYTTYPTWGAFTGTKVTNCTIDGLHVYLWCDSGYRKNKPAASGSGDDQTAYGGVGNSRGTVSIGYGIRPADWTGGLIQNCTLIDNGYHAAMYVGDHCTNNVFRNIVAWGGGVNPYSGGSTGAFYTGPGAGYDNNNNVKGCVAENFIAHRYTLLGTDQACVASPVDSTDDADPLAVTYCSYDGMLCHTNARSGSVSSTSTAAAAVITTSAAHSMYTGEQVTIEGHSGSSTINGTWTITVTGATTFTIPVQGVAGTATYFSASNVVEDVEFRDCEDIQYGDLTTHTTAPGAAYIGGARSKRASNVYDWRTYPIRYVRCKVVNGDNNLFSNETDFSFYRCRFEFPRTGEEGPTTGTTGGAFGSTSGYQNVNLTSCEMVMDMGSASARGISMFQHNFATTPNNFFLIGSSFFNTADNAAHASNTQRFFNFVNNATSDDANRLYARQCVFSHLFCKATTDTDGPERYLASAAYTGGTGVNATSFNVRDCMYANISTNGFITYAGGSAQNSGSQANYTTNIDPDGVYLGQDPTIANIALGNGPVMPFADMSGRTLELTGAAKVRTKFVWPNLDFSFNTWNDGSPRKYSNNYGAWQYGPSESTYRRVMHPRRDN